MNIYNLTQTTIDTLKNYFSSEIANGFTNIDDSISCAIGEIFFENNNVTTIDMNTAIEIHTLFNNILNSTITK